MPLFKEPAFDEGAERNRALARLKASRGRYNVSLAPYVIPLVGAVLAMLFAYYGLTRPSPADRLRETQPFNRKPNPEVRPVPQEAPLEVELE